MILINTVLVPVQFKPVLKNHRMIPVKFQGTQK